jgi:hypothetical protein
LRRLLWFGASFSTTLKPAIRAVKSGKNALIDRTRYQFGSLSLKKRAKGADVWEFRHYETQADNTRKRKATFIGTTTQYKNKSDARVAVEALLLRLNEEKPQHHLGAVTFGAICDRYTSRKSCQNATQPGSRICRISSCIFAQGGSATCCTRSGQWWSKVG